MTLSEVATHLDCEVILGEHLLALDFDYAFGSDLMSDVLAHVEHETLLITGLVNNQVIRTAEMLDIKAIVFVRGKKLNQELIEMAKEQDIALLATKHTMYTASGILYSKGLPGLLLEV